MEHDTRVRMQRRLNPPLPDANFKNIAGVGAMLAGVWGMDASPHLPFLTALLYIGFLAGLGFAVTLGALKGGSQAVWTYRQMRLSNLTDAELQRRHDAVVKRQLDALERYEAQRRETHRLETQRWERERRRREASVDEAKDPVRPPFPDEPPPPGEDQEGWSP